MVAKHDREPPERVDFAALDPRAEGEHFDRLVARIRTAATPELLRRQEAALGLWGTFARWRRTILATSAALALASVLTLVLVEPQAGDSGEAGTILGLPDPWAEWVQNDAEPGPGDLLTVGRSER